ncbi:Sugar phosphate isomerase/epimerase [Novosphingobium sp. CF614]|uniref:sugar phosphate isomerase/epimerase family protein n=1 Tax=Novosphingobium sp. CF614 TaxID=1884364 RepID=UPI0008EAB472|nr:sugar phosphate isomerase/epimerase family protein [Novosphingobium sp. CF614]SFF96156.1 Sugar phosphate isomerase/epimerase [Novosphingobium sp. CF614]
MPHPLGIELLTVLGMGPVEHVTLAADLGCTGVSLGLAQLPLNPCGYPAWSLREDAGLRRELKAVLRERGVVISIAEGISVSSGMDVSQRAADMDLLAELGTRRISAVDAGAERERAIDQCARLCEMARERGMEFSIEFCPVYTIRSLPDALEAVRRIGEDKASVVIDSMHFFRSGGTVRQIAELDPALIGHVQLCDAARKTGGDYRWEARANRITPGEGDLPLREFVDALPRGQMLGLEVPSLGALQNGRPMQEWVAEVVMKTRELLA